MIPPTGRLKCKKKTFREIVWDMRHVVFSVVRERQVPGGKGGRVLGTGFFVSQTVFITCDHVINSPLDPHVPGDSYLLVANLTGKSGKTYMVSAPQIGKEVLLHPEFDLAIVHVSSALADQPYCALEYGDVYEGEDVGVVGYPLAALTQINGNITMDGLIYRAARGHVTGRYRGDLNPVAKDIAIVEVNFLFVPGNSGGPVFSAETGRVLGFVHGYRAEKIREQIASITMLQPQLLQPAGLGSQYIENLNAIYSLAIKIDCIRATIEAHGVTL